MNAKEIVEKYSDKNSLGWSYLTMLEVACAFIDYLIDERKMLNPIFRNLYRDG